MKTKDLVKELEQYAFKGVIKKETLAYAILKILYENEKTPLITRGDLKQKAVEK